MQQEVFLFVLLRLKIGKIMKPLIPADLIAKSFVFVEQTFNEQLLFLMP